MNVPDRIAKAPPLVLALIAFEELLVLIDRTRNHIEVQPLGRLRALIHEQRERLRARVTQPFLDREAVSLRFGDLTPLLVEEELVVESFRRRGAECARDLA